MYVCGMTVYDYCHIGHARVMVVFDVDPPVAARVAAYDVTYVRNITDIDDKIIKRAAENGESIPSLTERFIRFMDEDAQALGVEKPDFEPRATEHVSGMLGIIEALMRKGLAYARRQRRCLLLGARVRRLRQAVRQIARRPACRRARRGGPVQARPPRLRVVEGGQTGRAVLGLALGQGPARLAYRVLRDERAVPGRAFRHSRRRPGPDFPASRE